MNKIPRMSLQLHYITYYRCSSSFILQIKFFLSVLLFLFSYITSCILVILRNCVIFPILSSGPRILLRGPFPMVALLWGATRGQSTSMCWTESLVWQPTHMGSGPLGLSIRWQWVMRVWLRRSRAMITSVSLSVFEFLHGFTSVLMLFNLLFGGSVFHRFCHFLNWALLINGE